MKTSSKYRCVRAIIRSFIFFLLFFTSLFLFFNYTIERMNETLRTHRDIHDEREKLVTPNRVKRVCNNNRQRSTFSIKISLLYAVYMYICSCYMYTYIYTSTRTENSKWRRSLVYTNQHTYACTVCPVRTFTKHRLVA